MSHSNHRIHSGEDTELLSIEEQLSQLNPDILSSEMLDRMELVMGSAAALSAGDDLMALEARLEQMSPAAVPGDMLTRMCDAMDQWHEHPATQENVVSFIPAQKTAPRFLSGGMLAAAAAVAVLGAVAALVLPHISSPQSSTMADAGPDSQSFTESAFSTPDIASSEITQNATFTSDALSHKVTSTRDRGVIFSEDNTPLRCIRIDYVDQIKITDKEGREIDIKTPGVDFMLIPVETN